MFKTVWYVMTFDVVQNANIISNSIWYISYILYTVYDNAHCALHSIGHTV